MITINKFNSTSNISLLGNSCQLSCPNVLAAVNDSSIFLQALGHIPDIYCLHFGQQVPQYGHILFT